MNDEEQIPEFLREPGIPGRSGDPPERIRPGSGQLPGKIETKGANTFSREASERQAPTDDKGRSLMLLEDLDQLLPQLGLRAYRPRIPWQRESPSVKQLEYLRGIGIDPAGFTSRGVASKVLDFFRGRRESGKASLRQLTALIGAEIPGAEHVSFEDAKRILAERYSQKGRR